MASTLPSGSVICPLCRGAGGDCPSCRGIGVATLDRGRWVYWSLPISSLAIAERRLERGVNAVIAILLMAFGVLGLAGLAWLVAENEGLRIAPWVFASDHRGDLRLVMFAVSILTDLFLVYRMLRSEEVRTVLPRQQRDADQQQSVAAERIRTLPAHLRVNIAQALTPEALLALEQSWQLASQFGSRDLHPLYAFATLLSFRTISVVRSRLGTDDAKLSNLVRRVLQGSLQKERGHTVLGPAFRAFVFAAYASAMNRRAERIAVTDLFAAAVTESPEAQAIFEELGVDRDAVTNVIAWMTIQEDLRRQFRYFRSRARFKPKGEMDRALTAIATPYLDRFSADLTGIAKRGGLTPCIGRDDELESILRLLEGGHNVLLVGETGVGKSTLIGGVAQRMVTEDVPRVLQDKRLVSLSIPTLVGSRGGGVEERLNRVLSEAARAGNIVLVLEDIQNLVGVGSTGAQTLDLSEILGAALGATRLRVLATTTPADERQFVEPSVGLHSHFSRLPIAEATPQTAIRILEGLSGMVEYEHHVYFSYAAIERLVNLSLRYFHDQVLPQKALTLMEEVAVAVREQHGEGAVVTAEDVAGLVSQKTHIELTHVTEEESAKLLHLEERMHERVVGQDEAVQAVAGALRRARVELRDLRRPIVNLLFLGPTGVGKTELAKTVARVYFGAEERMIRLDMSEYQEPSSVSRLIGSAPGYGNRQGGYLTDAVRENPFSLVLLDELEKAHPDILNLFLQVMDDGRLTDSAGRTADFTNVILIATSNAGTQTLLDGLRAGMDLETIKNRLLTDELPQSFRPEFLNRFDHVVVFRPLSKSEIIQVTRLLLGDVAARLAEKGIALEASDAAIRQLAESGYDQLNGARPLRRLVQDHVDNALAQYLLTGTLGRRDRAILDADGSIRVEHAPALWDRMDSPQPPQA